MAGKGRAPKPAAVLRLAGATKTNDDRLRAAGGRREVPGTPHTPDFDDDETAARIWNETIPLLAEVNLLSRVDGATFERYCRVRSLWNTIYFGMARGEEPPTKLLTLNDQLLRLEQQFGMTPASRIRVSEAGPKADKTGADDKSRFFQAG